jgi:hypothetical protein
LLSLVTGAGEDRQAGIFLETSVGQSQLAEEKYRSAVGLDASRVNAFGAESSERRGRSVFRGRNHWISITVETFLLHHVEGWDALRTAGGTPALHRIVVLSAGDNSAYVLFS